MASLAAAIANLTNLSSRLSCLTVIYLVASNPFTSAPICDGKGFGVKAVRRLTPVLPDMQASQKSLTLFPTGVIAPTPVRTTLFFDIFNDGRLLIKFC